MIRTPLFLINLDARSDRRAFMEAQFTDLGLSADRVSALRHEDVTEAQRQRYCNPVRAHFLSPQQFACTTSHVRAWKAMIASGAERALILEDDVILSPGLPAFLAELPGFGFDILRIETTSRPHLTGPLLDLKVDDIGFRRFRSTGWGAAAYIISRDCCERLIADERLYDLPTDAALFCPLELPGSRLDLYQADPALCIQAKERLSSVMAPIVSNNINSFLAPRSLRAWWTMQRRALRWGWIKAVETFTHPDLKRRVITFADKKGT